MPDAHAHAARKGVVCARRLVKLFVCHHCVHMPDFVTLVCRVAQELGTFVAHIVCISGATLYKRGQAVLLVIMSTIIRTISVLAIIKIHLMQLILS